MAVLETIGLIVLGVVIGGIAVAAYVYYKIKDMWR